MARGHASFYGGDGEEEYRQCSDISSFLSWKKEEETKGRDGGYHRQPFLLLGSNGLQSNSQAEENADTVIEIQEGSLNLLQGCRKTAGKNCKI